MSSLKYGAILQKNESNSVNFLGGPCNSLYVSHSSITKLIKFSKFFQRALKFSTHIIHFIRQILNVLKDIPSRITT